MLNPERDEHRKHRLTLPELRPPYTLPAMAAEGKNRGGAKRHLARFAAGCLAVAACLLIGATASQAINGGLFYASLEKAVPDSGPDHLGRTVGTIFCHGSRPHPTGGGVQISGDNSNFDLEVASIDTIGHSWAVEVNNDSGSPAQMTETAICSSRGGPYSYPDATRAIPAGEQVLKRVSCPAGTSVTGGGVSTTGDHTGVEVASTEPADGPDRDSKPDDAWLGTANNGTTGGARMGVVAVCAGSGRYRYVKSPKETLVDNSTRSSQVPCPDNTHVTGGGIDITGINIGIEVAGTFPEDGEDAGGLADDGWVGVANNDNSGDDEKFRTFAICKV